MKNRAIDLEDPLRETPLDDAFFVGYKDRARDTLPVQKKSKRFNRKGYLVLYREILLDCVDCRNGIRKDHL